MLMFEIPLLFSSLGPVIEMTTVNVLANTAYAFRNFLMCHVSAGINLVFAKL